VKPKRQFKDVFEPAMEFLSGPWKLYESGSFTMKRIVLKLAFKPLIPYTRETGVRTAQPSDIFEFFEKITSKCEMVPPHGLEPRTY